MCHSSCGSGAWECLGWMVPAQDLLRGSAVKAGRLLPRCPPTWLWTGGLGSVLVSGGRLQLPAPWISTGCLSVVTQPLASPSQTDPRAANRWPFITGSRMPRPFPDVFFPPLEQSLGPVHTHGRGCGLEGDCTLCPEGKDFEKWCDPL